MIIDNYTQNNKYVKYDINHPIVAVRSALGTGKTEVLINHIK